MTTANSEVLFRQAMDGALRQALEISRREAARVSKARVAPSPEDKKQDNQAVWVVLN